MKKRRNMKDQSHCASRYVILLNVGKTYVTILISSFVLIVKEKELKLYSRGCSTIAQM